MRHLLVTALALGLSLSVDGLRLRRRPPTAPRRPSVSATEHNDADVAFATDMIQHHAQALSMVDLTMGRDLDPEVQALAERHPRRPGTRDRDDDRLAHRVGRGDPRDRARPRQRRSRHGREWRTTDDADMPGMMTADDMAALEDAADGSSRTCGWR